MLAAIRSALSASLDSKIVDELLEAYTEAKRNFHLGGLRLNAVEGGRFCEAAFRLLQQRATGSFTPIGVSLNAEQIRIRLENETAQPDSVRFHIPRALRVVYGIRSKRDAAHLGDGIDPNLQDATLVVSVLDWVLAEFVRLYHNVSADEAQGIVETLVRRQVPAVQDFAGFPKVLRPQLRAGDYILLLLYQVANKGATFDQLTNWARPSMRANLRRTLKKLTNDQAFVHFDGTRYYVTQAGIKAAEDQRLSHLAR
jgi:hypothetical protein